MHSDREDDLAARRAGQELTERDEIGVVLVVEPLPLLDDLGPKISEMCDRSSEGEASELQERREDLG
jgi:hypothetical protein